MGEKRKRSNESHSEVSHTQFVNRVAADANCLQTESVVGGVGETPEMRQKVESAEPVTPQPLTKENLALLEGNMGKKRTTEGVTTSDSKTNKTGTKYYRKQAEVLGCNNIKQPGTALETETGRNIVKAAKELIKETRESEMKEEERKDWIENREDEKYSNEDTFINIMWRILVLETRTVKKPAMESLKDNQSWMLVDSDWDEDGLTYKVNQIFKSKTVPVKGGELEKYLTKLDDIKTPKPNLVYGLRFDAFNKKERAINIVHDSISVISEGMLYPFFVIEFRSVTGDLEMAKVQACGAGAALVYAMRQLREKAGLTNENDENDVGRIAFSIAMDTAKANIYVHWAENKTEGQVVYYMHRVKGFDLEEETEIPELRSHINNILTWGVLNRKTYIKAMLARIENLSTTSTSAES